MDCAYMEPRFEIVCEVNKLAPEECPYQDQCAWCKWQEDDNGAERTVQ